MMVRICNDIAICLCLDLPASKVGHRSDVTQLKRLQCFERCVEICAFRSAFIIYVDL